MKSLCTNKLQRTELSRLIKLVTKKTLNGTQAWSLFSSPDKSIAVGDKTYKVETKDARDAMKALKLRLRADLYKRYAGTCVYCRRPVAHYGYGWQIEHVHAKSWHGEKTFSLDNLVVACIECNSWKAHLDKRFKRQPLPIVNPFQDDFEYGKHLRFISVTTERLSIAKYKHLTPKGEATYTNLRFEEIERSVLVDSIDITAAMLHARMDNLISHSLAVPGAEQLADLLSKLKSKLYAK